LAKTKADVSSVRSCFAGGDAVPLHVHERFHELTGLEVSEVWGMTECLTSAMNPPFGRKKPGSIGLPVREAGLRVIDAQGRDAANGEVGELLVKSPAMFVGYWNNPEATAAAIQDGWLHTGDLARLDEDGYYWFVGRKKEIIIRGGSNISPLEVEEAIDGHPAVLRSGVVGAPDAHYGQVVVAYVVLREGAPPVTEDDLRRFVAQRLAAYKVPERHVFVPDLPLNPTGKVDRHALRARQVGQGLP
jgi:acyl-CoA synthetase (AMP-forming)/AMP-acid ligase II